MLLHHKFIESARTFGDKLAFIDRSVDRKITYDKALIASLILCRNFSKCDSGFLGIMLPTSAGAALSIIAALMSGRVPVIINYSTGAAQNVEFAQKQCGFKTVVTSKALLEKIECPKLTGMIYIEDIMAGITVFDKVFAALKSKLPINLLKFLVYRGREDEPSVILFTSGSEKEPKAVQLTHRNILSNIEGFSESLNLQSSDSMLVTLPYFHVFGLTTNMWTPLYHGMNLITYANPLDFQTVATIVREEKPTMVVGTPSFFWGYLHKSEPGDYESVRLAICGADKCPDALRAAFIRKHNLTLLEGYGTTETSPVISVNLPDANKPGSVGKPLANLRVRIENYESGRECEIGEVGKILIKGELVMKGYFHDLEETSLRIRNGWYDTGDMGYLDEDGFLWHSGRLKRFVKVGGEMISLVNVEEILGKHVPEGIEFCVVDIPDLTKGARIVVALTGAIETKEVMRKVSRDLPKIALPKQFVVIGDLPKMGSGKIDFRATTEIVRNFLFEKSEQKSLENAIS